MKNRLDDYDQYKEISCEFDNIEMLNGKVLVEVDLNLTTESGLIIPFAGSLTESYDREGRSAVGSVGRGGLLPGPAGYRAGMRNTGRQRR